MSDPVSHSIDSRSAMMRFSSPRSVSAMRALLLGLRVDDYGDQAPSGTVLADMSTVQVSPPGPAQPRGTIRERVAQRADVQPGRHHGGGVADQAVEEGGTRPQAGAPVGAGHSP